MVENSVLFHSVRVEEGARVAYSILMPGTVSVKAGAVVEYAIIAENTVVGEQAHGGLPLRTNDRIRNEASPLWRQNLRGRTGRRRACQSHGHPQCERRR